MSAEAALAPDATRRRGGSRRGGCLPAGTRGEDGRDDDGHDGTRRAEGAAQRAARQRLHEGEDNHAPRTVAFQRRPLVDGGHLSSFDIRRSASGLPPVWQVAQYCSDVSAKRHLAHDVAALRARLARAGVHPHAGALGVLELLRRLARRGLDRLGERLAQGGIQPVDDVGSECPGDGEGADLRHVEDLVGVGVADAGDELLVAQQPLDLGAAAGEHLAEPLEAEVVGERVGPEPRDAGHLRAGP